MKINMSKLRNLLAFLARNLPHFRGKGPIGVIITRLLTNYDCLGDCLVTIKMHDGSLMRIDVRSRTEQWAYWTGRYDQDIISRLATCLQEECIVFDVGANVGFYSIALGNKLAVLKGRLHAFEPVKNNFDRLIDCINLNGLDGVVSAHNLALSISA